MPPTAPQLPAPALLKNTRVPLDLGPIPGVPGIPGMPAPDGDEPPILVVGSHRILLDWPPLLDLWEILRKLFPLWVKLDFTMEHQQQTNWCWAATSVSVARYYDPTTLWTQCQVANDQLSRTDCCGTGASGPCNVYGFLGAALTTVGHFDHSTGSASTQATIRTEVDAGRPLGMRTAWSGGGAHFLCVIGYRGGRWNLVAVDDPIYGKSTMAYNTLKTAYQGTGSWTHSYFTAP